MPHFAASLRICGVFSAALAGAVLPGSCLAGERLLGTWGVNQVEGAAGGGLTPWAVIAGSGSSDQAGGSASLTQVRTQDGHHLKVASASVGIHNRVELSLSRWSFRLSDQVMANKSLEMSTVGVKVRLLGDAVHDQDRWWPQLSAGLQHKQVDDKALPRALGARETEDVDVYLTATKLWLAALGGHNVLANATLRYTRANQFGLLGFGGAAEADRTLQVEASLGLMLRDDLVVGAEVRTRPDNLGLAGFQEDTAWDVFVAWFPIRQASLTAAWLNLGNVATLKAQRGLYISAQTTF